MYHNCEEGRLGRTQVVLKILCGQETSSHYMIGELVQEKQFWKL